MSLLKLKNNSEKASVKSEVKNESVDSKDSKRIYSMEEKREFAEKKALLAILSAEWDRIMGDVKKPYFQVFKKRYTEDFSGKRYRYQARLKYLDPNTDWSKTKIAHFASVINNNNLANCKVVYINDSNE